MVAYNKGEWISPGTRVKVSNNTAPYAGLTGTVVPIKARKVWSTTNPGTRMTYVEIDGSARVFGFFTNNLERINEVSYTKNLIGPKPEPVTEPKFVAPFTQRGSEVVDANRRVVIKIQLGGFVTGQFSENLPMSERYDLAKIIAEALTEKFATKVGDSESPF